MTAAAWRQQLADAYRNAPAVIPAEPGSFGIAADEAGFLTAIRPLIDQGVRRFASDVAALQRERGWLPFDVESIGSDVLRNLPACLLGMLARVMTLELHVARLQGELTGETPSARFQSFLQLLGQRDRAWQILDEYSVLTRLLVQLTDQWCDFGVQFLTHLTDDYARITEGLYSGRDPGRLSRVHFGLGDRHRRGRSVVFAEFESGLCIVYKPKSLSVDVHFQQLLGWLNERGADPPLRTMRVLDCGNHGWNEFIAPSPCLTQSELERFYRRQGEYLALLRTIGGTDFHCDNVIACGEDPVLIDLEALFHRAPASEADDAWTETLRGSVMSTGLLPEAAFETPGGSPIDISGLGGAPGQQVADAGWQHAAGGTDEMRIVRQSVELPTGSNQPSNAAASGPHEFREQLIAGFRSMYDLVCDHQVSLLGDDGPIACFASDEVRFIARQTRSYAILLEGGLHPDRLRDEAAQAAWWESLNGAVRHSPWLSRLIPFEKTDLDRLDVPLFSTRPDSLDLFSSDGDRIKSVFASTGLESVAVRCRQMGPEDLERQLWLIDAALAGSANEDEHSSSLRIAASPDHPAAVDETRVRDRLIDAAAGIGDRLQALAWRHGESLNWLGLEKDGAQWKVRPLQLDLYDGLPGVALFYGYLGDITGEDRFRELARQTLNAVEHRIERNGDALTTIGGFTGWGGIVYAFSQLSELWQDDALHTAAERYADRLAAYIDLDEYLDVIDGAAGGLAGLLRLYRCGSNQAVLAAARRCGERLITTAQRMEHGLAWPLAAAGGQALTGFAHGTAGIRWALLELSSVCDDRRWRDAALETLEFDRSRDFTVDEWQPPRGDAEPATPGLNASWCHGAAGVALSRLQGWQRLGDPQLKEEALASLSALRAMSSVGNHSLCHGDLGNLDVLLVVANTLDDALLQEEVNARTSRLVAVSSAGWLCATPHAVETPGLMTGLAGIGYALLRLAAPNEVPSVLSWASR